MRRGFGPSVSLGSLCVSHFEAVGFAVGDYEEQKALIETAFERAVESGDVVRHPDGLSATYRDPSGALFTIHKNLDGGFHCGKPGFESRSRARWRPVHVVRDRECAFCDLVYAELLDDDEMVYPFLLSVETIGAERALIPYDEPGEVRFAGLWEEGEVWADEETFDRAQTSQWADVKVPEAIQDEIPAFGGFSSRSVISSGTFGVDGPQTSHVIAHGIVDSVEERRNELGRAPFLVVRLDTSGGIFDTCLAPGTLDHDELLAPGAVARATLWLVGRPLTLRDQPGAVPAVEAEGQTKRGGLLRRAFRRR